MPNNLKNILRKSPKDTPILVFLENQICIVMEYIALEKGALEIVRDRFKLLKEKLGEFCPMDNANSKEGWIENAQLAQALNVSLRTLQSYRERGAIGFSTIGRKIYYKISDVEELLSTHKISSGKEVKLRKN